MIDDSCRKTVGQEIVKQWEVMLKKLCEAVGKPNSRTAKCIRDCLADAGLGNPTAIECLTKRCGKPSILKCTSSDELNCPTKNKAPCCQKDGVWKDIMMPPCASTGCTGGRNVFDPGAITVVCNSWLTWSDKCSNPSPCGQGSLGGNDPTHLVTIVHEFLHACAECPAPEVPHKNQFNDAAKCILQNCLGYRI